MTDLPDEDIGAAVRPLIELSASRNENAALVESLRLATDPEQMETRAAAGEAMAALDRRIIERSVAVFSELGLRDIANLLEIALRDIRAEDAARGGGTHGG